MDYETKDEIIEFLSEIEKGLILLRNSGLDKPEQRLIAKEMLETIWAWQGSPIKEAKEFEKWLVKQPSVKVFNVERQYEC